MATGAEPGLTALATPPLLGWWRHCQVAETGRPTLQEVLTKALVAERATTALRTQPPTEKVRRWGPVHGAE